MAGTLHPRSVHRTAHIKALMDTTATTDGGCQGGTREIARLPEMEDPDTFPVCTADDVGKPGPVICIENVILLSEILLPLAQDSSWTPSRGMISNDAILLQCGTIYHTHTEVEH